MFKIIIAIMFIYLALTNDGISTYKDVASLSDLGSLLNNYLATMTAVILLAFGLDDIYRK